MQKIFSNARSSAGQFDSMIMLHSMNHLESLLRFGDDSMLVVWGTVKNFRIFISKKKAHFHRNQRRIADRLYIYSLLKK